MALAGCLPRAFPRFCCVLVLFITLGAAPANQAETGKSYQIKAVFLFNFAQFVEWPQATFPAAASPLIIGVLGRNPFGSFLDETVRGEHIHGHPIIVQRYSDVRDIKTCHILFINLQDPDEMENALVSLKHQNTLTVSDASRFIQRGGMVQFFTENNRTRIRIDPGSAKAADLVISSKLLRLADIVYAKRQ